MRFIQQKKDVRFLPMNVSPRKPHGAPSGSAKKSPRARPLYAPCGISTLTKKLLAKPVKECSHIYKDHDFSGLLSLFSEPVYGGNDFIIKKYLTYEESRKECSDVGCVWKCDDSVYCDYQDPPRLPRRDYKDWLFSSVFYVALDDEADVFPDKLLKVLSAIVETKNQVVFNFYPQALRILHCLHVELRCPVELHEEFWRNHRTASSGNFASLISRITRLAESRFAAGYPSYSTQLRLRRIQEFVIGNSRRKSLKADLPSGSGSTHVTSIASESLSINSEDMYSPIKPRSDSLLGQTPQQIRRRARDTILQTDISFKGHDTLAPVNTKNLGMIDRSCKIGSPISEAASTLSKPTQHSMDNLETVLEDPEDSGSEDSDGFDRKVLEEADTNPSLRDGPSVFGSHVSLKAVSKYSVLPIIKQHAVRVQAFGDVVSGLSDPCVQGETVPDNDSRAIEGALRRFTEMGKMFATSPAALERKAFISAHKQKNAGKKEIVTRMLVVEFLDSLPWKMNEFTLLGEMYSNNSAKNSANDDGSNVIAI